jgi:3-dehydro-L-gulonate-6-phosphate decarboxylase
MKPKLQLALDLTSLEKTLTLIKMNKAIDQLDIIEVGTVLLASAGAHAIQEVRALFPDKIVVADLKLADAAKAITKMFYDAGADYTTVITAADIKTMEIAQNYAQERGKTIQIELYGHWDFDIAQAWYDLGIRHVIYHHSRDAGHSWGPSDLEKIRKFIEMGFVVNVTGGITTESIQLFKGLDIYAFIVGRGLYEADDIADTISRFKWEIDHNFT